MPRRGPEAGFHRIHYDFHGSGVNPIDSCLFLQRKKKNILPFLPGVHTDPDADDKQPCDRPGKGQYPGLSGIAAGEGIVSVGTLTVPSRAGVCVGAADRADVARGVGAGRTGSATGAGTDESMKRSCLIYKIHPRGNLCAIH